MLFTDQLRDLLGRVRRIAIIGAKDNVGSPADRVGRYLINAGFDVMPVHVVRDTTWGLPTAHNITELPEWGFEPDIVCLFRNPMYCEGHAREVLQLPKLPKVFWMQEGIRSPEAGKLMFEAGVKVVEDLCIKTVHEQLFRDKTETFSCQRCGKCCEGRGGIVVGPRDLTRLSVHFGLPGEEVLARYAEMMDGKPTLKVGDDGFCMFFKEGRGCTIHPARPSVCRAWPFFRGNLIDEVSFEMAREDCPGIRREASHAQFAHEGFRYLEDYKLRCHDIRTEGRAVIVEAHELPPL